MCVLHIRSALAVLAVTIASITVLAAEGAPAQSAAPLRIRVTLDGRIDGTAAPFLRALDEGYYGAEGLEVRIEPAADFRAPVNQVAAGAQDIGFADINALIRFRDRNPLAAVKAVFMLYNKAPYAIIARKSRGVSSPRDLEGKRFGAPETDPTSSQWLLFAKLNGIDPAKLRVENIGVPVREPMLAAGELDAALGLSFMSYVDLKARGVPVDDIVLLPMADYGLELYGHAIIVNTNFAAEHPDAVKGFLRAFLKALKDAIRDPEQAVAAVIARTPGAARQVELERLQMAVGDNILTAEVKSDGFGTVDSARFAAALTQMGIIFKFKAKPALSDIFDSSFLPSARARKLF